MTQSDKVHSAVQEHYGAVVRSLNVVQPSAESCYGSSSSQQASDCSCSSRLYDDRLLEGLPVDVTGLSMGCGDPVTIAALRPGETVLDLGSGGGIDCFLAAREVGETAYVIGVDMTPAMLEKARANKVKVGAHNVEFREGKIEALPVDDNTIDVVMSNCVINLSPDKPAVFHEVFRVLKPSGRVSISDVVTEGEFSPALRANMSQWAECVTGAIDVDAYTGLMGEVGFVDIQVVDRVEAEPDIDRKPGMPRVFSARVTARKPV